MDSELKNKLIACRGALAGSAARDADARRRHAVDEDEWMAAFGSPYAVDVNKLLCSKAIRRLGGKTQVVVLPKNSHTRDRLSHSFEVANIATTAARILGLNESLCQAAALGHDLGHTPLGHGGEQLVAEAAGRNFRHEVFGVVIAQSIERQGRGLNLTHQTLDAIRNHSRGAARTLGCSSSTAEGDLVMFSDKIGYIFADFNDIFMRAAQTGSRLTLADFPELAAGMAWFGANHRERNAACIAQLCLESAAKGRVAFEDCEAARRFAEVKKLMYGVYGLFDRQDAEAAARAVYDALGGLEKEIHPAVLFALMNDDDVRWLGRRLAAQDALTAADLGQLSIGDVIPGLRGRNIDFTEPDLDW